MAHTFMRMACLEFRFYKLWYSRCMSQVPDSRDRLVARRRRVYPLHAFSILVENYRCFSIFVGKSSVQHCLGSFVKVLLIC